MITAIVVKSLWALGGAVVGWLAKKRHFRKMVEALREMRREEDTPAERPV